MSIACTTLSKVRRRAKYIDQDHCMYDAERSASSISNLHSMDGTPRGSTPRHSPPLPLFAVYDYLKSTHHTTDLPRGITVGIPEDISLTLPVLAFYPHNHLSISGTGDPDLSPFRNDDEAALPPHPGFVSDKKQTDITDRSHLEKRLAALTEAQLRLPEQAVHHLR
eukprot:gene11331-18609_t